MTINRFCNIVTLPCHPVTWTRAELWWSKYAIYSSHASASMFTEPEQNDDYPILQYSHTSVSSCYLNTCRIAMKRLFKIVTLPRHHVLWTGTELRWSDYLIKSHFRIIVFAEHMQNDDKAIMHCIIIMHYIPVVSYLPYASCYLNTCRIAMKRLCKSNQILGEWEWLNWEYVKVYSM